MGNRYDIPVENIIGIIPPAIDLKALFLYGSHLYGTHHKDSDVDVLVLTNRMPHPTDVRALTKRLDKIGISAFILSETSFNQIRNHTFFFAAALEEIARTGVRLRGEAELKPILNEEQIIIGTWISSLLALRQWKYLKDPKDAAKVMMLGTLVAWELERIVDLQGIFSQGLFIHRFMTGELSHITRDSLFKFIEKSGILWRWISDEIDCDSTCLEDWAAALLPRLTAHAQLVNKLSFGGLTAEGFNFIEGNPLYQNINWQQGHDQLFYMQDRGQRFLFNFIKLCIKSLDMFYNPGHEEKV